MPVRTACWLSLLLSLLVPPPAAATPAEPDWGFAFSFEDAPRVGETVTLVAVVDVPSRGTFRLHVSEGVHVDGDPEWRLADGKGERRTWQVTVPRPMFWTAALYPAEGQGTDGVPCCLRVWSGSSSAAWDLWGSDRLRASLPPAAVVPSWDLEALGTDRVRVTFTGDGSAEWWPFINATTQVVRLRITTPYEERGLGVRVGEPPLGPALELDLRDGQRHDLAVAVTWNLLFPPPPAAPGWAPPWSGGHGWLDGEAYCRSHVLQRDGDRLTLDDGTPCPRLEERSVAAPPALAAGLALLAAAGQRRRRTV